VNGLPASSPQVPVNAVDVHVESARTTNQARELSHFERNAKDDPEFMFLLVSLKREKTISTKEVAPLRAKLMKEKWQPDFYR